MRHDDGGVVAAADRRHQRHEVARPHHAAAARVALQTVPDFGEVGVRRVLVRQPALQRRLNLGADLKQTEKGCISSQTHLNCGRCRRQFMAGHPPEVIFGMTRE